MGCRDHHGGHRPHAGPWAGRRMAHTSEMASATVALCPKEGASGALRPGESSEQGLPACVALLHASTAGNIHSQQMMGFAVAMMVTMMPVRDRHAAMLTDPHTGAAPSQGPV